MSEENIEWIKSKNKKITQDERAIITIYRLCKRNHKFIAGLIVGCIITVIVLK